jgi:hypothetical protein
MRRAINIFKRSTTSLVLAVAIMFSMNVLVYADEVEFRRQGIIHFDEDPIFATCGLATGQNYLLSRPPTGAAPPTGDRLAFIEEYAAAAIQVGAEFGIPYDAILAQAALESGNGLSTLTVQANNFFGIKAGSGWDGEIITLNTREERPDGTEFFVDADFRAYPTPADGFRGYGEFITNSPHYDDALAFPNDPIEYVRHLLDRDEPGELAYATDTRYLEIFTGVLEQVQAYFEVNGAPANLAEGACAGSARAGVAPPTPGVPDGWTFPILTTQSYFSSAEYSNALTPVPCNAASCHHDYPAVDIGGIGQQVVAVLDGTIIDVDDIDTPDPAQCDGTFDVPRLHLEASDGRVYYYTHLAEGSVSSRVSVGQQVSAGEVLGIIGGEECAQGTPPHLHIDMTAPNPTVRQFARSSADNYEAARANTQDIAPFINAAFEGLDP